VNCDVMVAPHLAPGAHVVYVCGEDAAAKQTVVGMLHSFGWAETSVIDLGGIEAARGTEMYLALWLRLMRTLGTPHFNVGLHVGA
jgi:predicted dinucleotide-binding enzyme